MLQIILKIRKVESKTDSAIINADPLLWYVIKISQMVLDQWLL